MTLQNLPDVVSGVNQGFAQRWLVCIFIPPNGKIRVLSVRSQVLTTPNRESIMRGQ